jgi:transposase InsO family protein
MRFAFIAKHRHVWPVSWLCEALDVSRSGFHAWLHRGPSAREAADEGLTVKIRSSFVGSARTYGARRVWRDVLAEGLSCGLHKVERLMRMNALRARPRRRRLPKDDGARSPSVAPNLLDRQFAAERPNQRWIADFTYVWTAEGWLYVAAVIDLFSRRVVGWSMKAEMTAQLVTDALLMAIWRRGRPDALLHHSDQGSQGGFKRSSQRGHSVLCQPTVKGFGRCHPVEGFPWSPVESGGNGGERRGAMHAQICALRKVLAQQSIGVLVGAALPRALRIAEVDLDACVDFKRRVLGHLGALVPSQRTPKFPRQG